MTRSIIALIFTLGLAAGTVAAGDIAGHTSDQAPKRALLKVPSLSLTSRPKLSRTCV